MLAIIVAYDENRLIGSQNTLPWHLPADLAHFKRTTTGHTVVMGRKTFESIGRPLPGRKNVVITRDENWSHPGVEVVTDFSSYCEQHKDREERIFIIGGAEIYAFALPYTKQLYITHIHHAFIGDAYFPLSDLESWHCINKESGIVDEKNKYNHTFAVYERK